MSNVHLGLNCVDGSIDHSLALANDIGSLYLNDQYSDISLNVNGQKFHGHKVILASRSSYFRALLFGEFKEKSQEEIEIIGANLNSFKLLLKYIYTGLINLSAEKEDVVLDILGLAHQYGFEDLESSVCNYLKDTLSVSNVCLIYDIALLYTLVNLGSFCEDYIDKHAPSVLTHDSFYTLSPNAMKSIIKRNSFCAAEVQIFQSLQEWHKHNGEIDQQELRDILSLIRLPLMSLSDLLNSVRPTGLISPDAILDAIKSKNESRDTELDYRGYQMLGENVAVPSKDAVVLTGEMRLNLLDGNYTNYDMDRGFTRHSIDDNSGLGILIKLGRQCILNSFKLLLWDKDHRAYSYFIEISVDQNDWVRVIDHTQFHCRSWQFLHFPPRVVRYIRVVGTNNTINRVFHLVHFEAAYIKPDIKLMNNVIVPKENVALVSKSAKVIEGVSRSRNNLLNGDVYLYDWDSGYTCHQLGSGAICIQLGQPYYLSSCRLLLWDCDERSYSYYIEASVNGRDWEVIYDKTRETCRSWQTIFFPQRPIVYFKIVGTFNTANEVFHCVHFETPAQLGSEIQAKMQLDSQGHNYTEAHPPKQPQGLEVNEAPMRPQSSDDGEDGDENKEGVWMGAGDGPPSNQRDEQQQQPNAQQDLREENDYLDFHERG